MDFRAVCLVRAILNVSQFVSQNVSQLHSQAHILIWYLPSTEGPLTTATWIGGPEASAGPGAGPGYYIFLQ